MRVLIIDDEESICKTTSVLLAGMGHEAACAESGAAALNNWIKARSMSCSWTSSWVPKMAWRFCRSC